MEQKLTLLERRDENRRRRLAGLREIDEYGVEYKPKKVKPFHMTKEQIDYHVRACINANRD